MTAPKNKWKFILTRGVLLAGMGLFVFFQLVQWIKSDMGLVVYMSSVYKVKITKFPIKPQRHQVSQSTGIQ